ncbi:MAG: hypothetical protein Kow0091_32880 [Geminocystis sp.]|uniref:NADH:ubiquinone oxidoreductase complex I intermediate-associated protein 30 n=2 Tax=Cyanobacterium TaxID=102234 RepID=K9Z313_CYAAP|nr:NADH:ubiquinone oxidoreductase complex I intermediate-associated protein 30 [Cyanobacterium aponinum PCC 10605]
MKIKQLWETLTFFEVIPFFNCFTNFFNISQHKTSPLISTMNFTLICYDHSPLAQETLNNLQQQNIPLRILNTSSFNPNPSEKTEIIKINLLQDSLSPHLLERVDRIFCFPQPGINNLINLINQQLFPGEIILCDLRYGNENQRYIWGAVDDVVMGGVSSSNLFFKENKAIFTGNVSTDNNGGFVSVRSKNFNPPWDLSAYEGIRLRVQGDGNRYKFITRCEGKWDGISYCYSFNTIANVWMTIDIPFKDLIPVFRAKTVNADQFDQTRVYSLQLMLSKFEYDGAYNPTFRAGVFSLEIESIKAYGKPNSPQLILMDNQVDGETMKLQ